MKDAGATVAERRADANPNQEKVGEGTCRGRRPVAGALGD